MPRTIEEARALDLPRLDPAKLQSRRGLADPDPAEARAHAARFTDRTECPGCDHDVHTLAAPRDGVTRIDPEWGETFCHLCGWPGRFSHLLISVNGRNGAHPDHPFRVRCTQLYVWRHPDTVEADERRKDRRRL